MGCTSTGSAGGRRVYSWTVSNPGRGVTAWLRKRCAPVADWVAGAQSWRDQECRTEWMTRNR
jgi:hypothetical protein